MRGYNTYLIQNSQAVKKECGPQKGYGEKRRWWSRNGCGGRLMVKILIMTIQVNLVPLGLGIKFTLIAVIKNFTINLYHHGHFLAATLDFTYFSP